MPDTENKPKRGRPKKTAPLTISEDSGANNKRLQMAEGANNTSQMTVTQVQKDLSAYYAKVLGVDHGNLNWLASLNNLQSHNPFLQNQRLKTISDIPGVLSGEALAKALGAPQNNEIALRRQGWALSASQYLYYKILRMAADVPLFKYYKTPELLTKDVYGSKKFLQEDKFVDEWLQTFDVVNTLKRVSLEVKHEGKCVYVLRNSIREDKTSRHVNYCTWQKLPSDYVKLTGIGEHGYIASFNMLLFLNPAFNIRQYPDFIQDIWMQMIQYGAITDNMIGANDPTHRFSIADGKSRKNHKKNENAQYTVNPQKLMEFSYSYEDSGISKSGCGVLEAAKDSYMFWVQLPQELCYVFASDTSNAWAVPDTIGLFTELQNLTDYDTLAGLIVSTPLTAILTAEIPLIADANLNAGADQTALSPDTVIGYQNKFNDAVSSNLDAYIAPFTNMKLQSLPNVPNSSDITTKATQNFVNKSSMGGLISTTEKPSVSQVKAAQLLYESECDFVTRQFESVLNMIINELIGTEYEWKLHIWGGIYSFENEVKRDKEMFVSGGTFVLPKIASAYNMTLRDIKSVDGYIESLDLYSDFKTITQANQENNGDGDDEDGSEPKKQGRPNADENNIENDNTAKSIEAGNDTSETREFALFCKKECICMICKKPSDSLICDECKEEFELEE